MKVVNVIPPEDDEEVSHIRQQEDYHRIMQKRDRHEVHDQKRRRRDDSHSPLEEVDDTVNALLALKDQRQKGSNKADKELQEAGNVLPLTASYAVSMSIRPSTPPLLSERRTAINGAAFRPLCHPGSISSQVSPTNMAVSFPPTCSAFTGSVLSEALLLAKGSLPAGQVLQSNERKQRQPNKTKQQDHKSIQVSSHADDGCGSLSNGEGYYGRCHLKSLKSTIMKRKRALETSSLQHKVATDYRESQSTNRDRLPMIQQPLAPLSLPLSSSIPVGRPLPPAPILPNLGPGQKVVLF